MKYVGKCKDRAGNIMDLYQDGDKYYRENPLPQMGGVLGLILPIGLGIGAGVVTDKLMPTPPIGKDAFKTVKPFLSIGVGATVATVAHKMLTKPSPASPPTSIIPTPEEITSGVEGAAKKAISYHPASMIYKRATRKDTPEVAA